MCFAKLKAKVKTILFDRIGCGFAIGDEAVITKIQGEKMKPFDGNEKIIYEKDSFKMVVGKASTNKEEEFCIGLNSNGFPAYGNAYVVFPPQLSLVLLRNLLGEEGAKNEQIMEAIKQIVQ